MLQTGNRSLEPRCRTTFLGEPKRRLKEIIAETGARIKFFVRAGASFGFDSDFSPSVAPFPSYPRGPPLRLSTHSLMESKPKAEPATICRNCSRSPIKIVCRHLSLEKITYLSRRWNGNHSFGVCWVESELNSSLSLLRSRSELLFSGLLQDPE